MSTVERAQLHLAGSARLEPGAARVFTFHGRSSGSPLVFVMTWEGEADGIPRLVEAVAHDGPVHVVAPPSGTETHHFPRDVEAWVDHVESALAAAAVGDVQHWAGWSFGGVVAARAAQRRWRQARPGAALPHVVLLDSRSPTTMDKRAPDRSAPHRALRSAVAMLDMDGGDRRAYVSGGLKRIKERRKRSERRSSSTYMTPLRKAIYVAWWKYEAVPLEIEGTLLWTRQSVDDVGDRFLGWGDAWSGPFHALQVGEGHFDMFDEPTVSTVARRLSDALSPRR